MATYYKCIACVCVCVLMEDIECNILVCFMCLHVFDAVQESQVDKTQPGVWTLTVGVLNY